MFQKLILSLPRDAFQIMLNAQKKINTAKLPPKVTVFCEKDTMYNDLLLLLETKELCWKSEEVQSGTATLALQTLRDALWYIDGMHGTFNERSCMIHKCFEKFTGYNRPEQHKHKKRCHTSMSEIYYWFIHKLYLAVFIINFGEEQHGQQ